jgi:hypothetical protein
MKNIQGNVSYISGIAMCFGSDPDSAGNANLKLDGNIAMVRIINKDVGTVPLS